MLGYVSRMSIERKTYRVNEVFYSLQGEGVRSGTPNVFVRFSGCNLQCDLEPGPLSPGGFACDTEFMSGQTYDASELIETMINTGGNPRGALGCSWCILTGGEPLLQVDAELIDQLRLAGYQLALETNGTRRIPAGIDYVVVSPKVAEHAVRAQRADELRYVRAVGQGIPRPSLDAQYFCLSPAADGNAIPLANVRYCIDLVKENPKWRLSLQQHKLLAIR